MATRCNPVDDIDILHQAWSTWLDPTQNPPEERPYGSKALINARRWNELGFTGAPPKLWAPKDEGKSTS